MKHIDIAASIALIAIGTAGCSSTTSPQADYVSTSLTVAEQQFVDAFDGLKVPDTILDAGKAWCTFFQSDRSQIAASESNTWANLRSDGFEDWAISTAFDNASSVLCPSVYQVWSDSMPDVYVGPESDYNLNPPEPDEPRDWGPRG
jgi:hypothetical protein